MYALSLENITKTYGLHPILKGVSFGINTGQRVGLTGPNGVGKSTLIKIIMGEVTPDSGTVTLAPDVIVGYQPQTIRSAGGQSLAAMIEQAMQRIVSLEAQMRHLETAMTTADGDTLDAILTEYGSVSEQFERYGGYAMASQVDTVLNGLGVGHIPREQAFDTLSGGEKARVGLAMLLLQTPDVLLLDEPTNHLDFNSITWLENYLQTYQGAVLIVSHDRYFLNRTITTILELEEHSRQVRQYSGNYDQFLALKAQERRKWIEDYARQWEEIKALRSEIKSGAHANSNYRAHSDADKFVRNLKKGTHDKTVSKRIQAAEEKLRRIEENPVLPPPKELRFNAVFDPQALKNRTPLVASGLYKAFGERVLLEDVSFTLGAKSRVVLVGPNGAGKSTLLKILMGQEPADQGDVHITSGITVGWLTQEDFGNQDHRTVLEAYSAGMEGEEHQHSSTLIQLGLFRYDELSKVVHQLSSGQRRKLQIARMIAQGANLLILDEPTNYISLDVLEELEAALESFSGPIIAASHDRRFMAQFGHELWELNDGRLINHAGGYTGYLERLALKRE